MSNNGKTQRNPGKQTLRISREQAVELSIPVVAVLLALLLGALLILFIGRSPLEAYSALLQGAFGSKRDIAAVSYTHLGDQDTDISWAIGFLLTDAVDTVASEYPDLKFGLIDSVVEQPNVASATFKEEEGCLLYTSRCV